MSIAPDNAQFVLLSFEGPDRYSLAGGLGTRVTELARALAQAGFTTHLIFIGDPNLPSVETVDNGNLHLYRWCQWISHSHPKGAYEAEWDKSHRLRQQRSLVRYRPNRATRCRCRPTHRNYGGRMAHHGHPGAAERFPTLQRPARKLRAAVERK